ncbi:hypothetical protein ACVXG9_04870 [Escherichia coli]
MARTAADHLTRVTLNWAVKTRQLY